MQMYQILKGKKKWGKKIYYLLNVHFVERIGMILPLWNIFTTFKITEKYIL